MINIIRLLSVFTAFLVALSSAFADSAPLLHLNTGSHTATVRNLLLNSDETILVSSGDDKVIRLWDAKSKQPIREIRGQVSVDLNGAINAMSLSPDDKWLAVSVFFPHQHNGREKRGYLRIHDFSTGKLIKILGGHSKALQSLKFSHDGTMLAGGESLEDNPLTIIWDTTTWRVRQSFSGHQAGISGIAYTPDLKRLITSSWDHSLRIWDIASGKNIKTIKSAHKGRVYGAKLPLDSDRPIVVTGGADKTVKIWNYETGKSMKSIGFKRRIRSVAVNRKGTRIVASSVGEFVNAWVAIIDAGSGKVLNRYREHNRTPRALTLLNDGNTVFSSGGFRHEIDRWSLADAKQIYRLTGVGSPIQSVAISADGSKLLWGNQPIDWSGKKYDFNKLAPLTGEIELSTIHKELGVPMMYSGKSSGLQRTVRKRGKLSLQRVKPAKGAFFTDLLIKRKRKVIGKIVRDKKTGHIHTAYSFTPDEKHVVTGGEGGYLSLHTLKGKKITDYRGHSSDITDIAISKDGKMLLSGSRDQTFKLWNLGTGDLLLSFFVATDGEWIVWTKTGHYTSSPNGDKYVGWVINQGESRNSDYVLADQIKGKLYRPDLINKVISEQSLSGALEKSSSANFSVDKVVQKQVIPLDFSLLSPQNQSNTVAESINLKLQLVEGDNNQVSWSVTNNQRQIISPISTRGLARKKLKNEEITIPIQLDPGTNEIRIVADNGETSKERNLVVTRQIVEVANKSIAEPTAIGVDNEKLLVISVGVDNYVNLPGHDLNFASADAEAIAEAFINQKGKNFDEVETILLSDNSESGATRDNIIDALDALAEIGSNDTVVLFLAGHGVIENGQYYFLPKDATASTDERLKKSTVVSWHEIQNAVQNSLGRRILLVDTCYSESAFNSRLVKDAEDADIIVMSSTDSTTLAQEISSLGHGVFTYSLVNGLSGDADSFRDKRITMSELNAYVSNSVPSLTKRAQIPTLSVPKGFQDFTLAQL